MMDYSFAHTHQHQCLYTSVPPMSAESPNDADVRNRHENENRSMVGLDVRLDRSGQAFSFFHS